MDDDAATGIVAMFVIIGVIFVVLFFVVRSAFSRAKLANVMQQGPTAKTGLVGAGSHFEGIFQGFPASLDVHLDFNVAGMVWNQRFGGARSFFHRYAFAMRVPGAQFPPTTFYESAWLGRLGDIEWQRRAPVGQRQPIGVPAIDANVQTHVTDPQFAARVAGNPELQAAMLRWPFLNLQLAGDVITLELIETWSALESRFGAPAMYGWDFAAQGLAMMASAARAAIVARPPLPAATPAYGR
jgi:hypothetical protein